MSGLERFILGVSFFFSFVLFCGGAAAIMDHRWFIAPVFFLLAGFFFYGTLRLARDLFDD